MADRIERVARAIAKCRGLNPDADLSEGPNKPAWKYFVEDAEAAIAELANG